jgi:cytochrome oxidase assembly protein ShyY1
MTYKAFIWQKKRKLEKIEEMDLRFKKLKSKPYECEKDKVFPWIDVDEETFRREWAFQPFRIGGRFEKERYVYIQRTKEGEPGYQLINPLYFNKKAVLVDRGWVPLDWEKIKQEIDGDNNYVEIVGVLYKGDVLNKYSRDKISKDSNILLTMDPTTIANTLDIPDKETAGTFIIKQLSDSDKNNLYPKKLTTNDLMTWTITPETHQSYSNFWLFITVANVLSNFYIWLI